MGDVYELDALEVEAVKASILKAVKVKRPRGNPIATVTLKTGEVAEFFVHRDFAVTMYAGWDEVTPDQIKTLAEMAHALQDCLLAISDSFEGVKLRQGQLGYQ